MCLYLVFIILHQLLKQDNFNIKDLSFLQFLQKADIYASGRNDFNCRNGIK